MCAGARHPSCMVTISYDDATIMMIHEFPFKWNCNASRKLTPSSQLQWKAGWLAVLPMRRLILIVLREILTYSEGQHCLLQSFCSRLSDKLYGGSFRA